jgi:hypothetical protein
MHRDNISFSNSINFIQINFSSNYTLAFRIGQNLSNIPIFMLSKQKFPLYLLYLSTNLYFFQDLTSFSSDQFSFLAQSFTSQVEYCALHNRSTHKFYFLYFSSHQSQFQVPTMEPFVGTGEDPGFNASTMHQQNPNYRPFRQHLRSRCSLTRGRGKGGYRTQVFVTKLGHRSVIITLRKVLRNNTH